MIIAFTGSRPQSLGGFILPNPIYNQVCQETEKLLLELKPEKCISGACIGYDQWAAWVCMKLGIPVVFALPFIGQEKKWPKESQEIYNKLLAKALEVIVVSEGQYSADKMFKRNRYLVDNADEIIACCGNESSGTKYTTDYAEQQNKPIHRIIPIT